MHAKLLLNSCNSCTGQFCSYHREYNSESFWSCLLHSAYGDTSISPRSISYIFTLRWTMKEADEVILRMEQYYPNCFIKSNSFPCSWFELGLSRSWLCLRATDLLYKSLSVCLFFWLLTPPTQSGVEQPNLARRYIIGSWRLLCISGFWCHQIP